VELGPAWQLVELDLTDEDLSGITLSCGWSVDVAQNDPAVKIHELHFDRIYVAKLERKPLN
jgi:hypothetical protein